MDDNSELHPKSLRIQCKKAIEVIDKENEAYEELINKLRTNIVENDLIAGETADSIKAYVSDLIMVVEYAIEANELDKADHQAILDSVDTVLADKVDVNEVLRGYDIHEEIRYLEEQISQYEEYINQEILYISLNALNEIKEYEYRDQIADLERVLQDYKYKEERYDTIDAETKTLFSGTSEIRGVATDAILEMKGSLINDEYKPSANSRWKAEFNKINIGRLILDFEDISDDSKDEVYEFVHDCLQDYFSEERILFLYKNKSGLVKSLYAAAHWDEKDCDKVIENMNRCCMEFEEKYSFVIASIKNKINVSDETAKKYLYYIELGIGLKTLWNTYTYSSLDYNILLDKFLTNDLSEFINRSKTYDEVYLDDVIFYDYIAVPKPGDIVTDLSDDKYQDLICKRNEVSSRGWLSFENTKGLAGMGEYYSTAGLDYELSNEKLTIICPGENCDGMDIYNNNNYLVDREGRYLITVGPLILNPDYDVYNGSFELCDFINYVGCEIDVVLQNDNNPSDIITLRCAYGGDIKAHTDDWGEGICMSGIRYENAIYSGNEKEDPDGSYIEFFALNSPTDDMINYSVINIIVRQ